MQSFIYIHTHSSTITFLIWSPMQSKQSFLFNLMRSGSAGNYPLHNHALYVVPARMTHKQKYTIFLMATLYVYIQWKNIVSMGSVLSRPYGIHEVDAKARRQLATWKKEKWHIYLYDLKGKTNLEVLSNPNVKRLLSINNSSIV